jgi:putative endonuclease
MSESQSLGQKGEAAASGFLEEKGYKIRHRNWKSGKHELDIIAENKDFVVFVEVKTRTEDFLLEPSAAVTREKQRSMIYAADGYIRRFSISKESRFDIISVISKEGKFEIDHIEGAFYPTLR